MLWLVVAAAMASTKSSREQLRLLGPVVGQPQAAAAVAARHVQHHGRSCVCDWLCVDVAGDARCAELRTDVMHNHVVCGASGLIRS